MDRAFEDGRSDIATLFRNFTRNWLIENDSASNHCQSNSEIDDLNTSSFHRNLTKHHIQNHDLFDEENDS